MWLETVVDTTMLQQTQCRSDSAIQNHQSLSETRPLQRAPVVAAERVTGWDVTLSHGSEEQQRGLSGHVPFLLIDEKIQKQWPFYTQCTRSCDVKHANLSDFVIMKFINKGNYFQETHAAIQCS